MKRLGETEKHLDIATEWMPITVSEQIRWVEQRVKGMPCLPTALLATDPHTNSRHHAKPWLLTAVLLLGQVLGEHSDLIWFFCHNRIADPSVSPWVPSSAQGWDNNCFCQTAASTLDLAFRKITSSKLAKTTWASS